MKKLKIAFWLLVIAAIGLIGFQNQEFFLSKPELRVNLFVRQYVIHNISIAAMLFGLFLFGLLSAYFSSLSGKFRANRTVKQLNATVAGHVDEISRLQSQVSTLRGAGAATAAEPAGKS